MDDERLRAVARKIVRECAGVAPARTSTSRAGSTRPRTSSCWPSSASSSGARPLVVMQSDELSLRRLLGASRGAARHQVREPGSRPSRPLTSCSPCAWSTATRRCSPTSPRRPSRAPPAAAASCSPTTSTTARGAGSAPTSRRPRRRAAYGVDVGEFRRTRSGALSTSTTALLARARRRICAVLEGADAVRIRSPKGTDVTLRIAGRPLDKDVGVVTRRTPAHESARRRGLPGAARGPRRRDAWSSTSRSGTGAASRTWRSSSSAGAAAPCAPPAGSRYFTGTLASASGARRRDRRAGHRPQPRGRASVTGYMLTDEKILGTIHIAVGENRMLGGVNESSLHWDLLVMRREPRGRRRGHPRRRAAGGLKDDAGGRTAARVERNESESERTMSDTMSQGGDDGRSTCAATR